MTAAQFKRLFPARACSGLAWRLTVARVGLQAA
jgi:hypothetical protein